MIGLSLVHRSGFLHSTVLSLFIGFIIVLVAVYTRQRTGFLMPRIKEAQDNNYYVCIATKICNFLSLDVLSHRLSRELFYFLFLYSNMPFLSNPRYNPI